MGAAAAALDSYLIPILKSGLPGYDDLLAGIHSGDDLDVAVVGIAGLDFPLFSHSIWLADENAGGVGSRIVKNGFFTDDRCSSSDIDQNSAPREHLGPQSWIGRDADCR